MEDRIRSWDDNVTVLIKGQLMIFGTALTLRLLVLLGFNGNHIYIYIDIWDARVV